MRLKSTLLITASSVAMLGIASAADMPIKAPPPVVPAPAWTGWYIGATGGVASHKWKYRNDAPDPGDVSLFWSDHEAGVIAGGHVGYNWQSDRFVFGIEVDGNWLNAGKRLLGEDIGPFTSFTLSSEIDWLVTVRGRAGLAVGETLLYLTGGVAFAGVTNRWFGRLGNGTGLEVGHGRKTKTGWVGGGGIEQRLSPNWSVRGEVLYADLGRSRVTTIDPGGTFTASFANYLLVGRAGVSFKW